MSHISKIELQILDLAVLKQACTRLGLTFVEGQKTFKWFSQEGNCDHAIKLPTANYEIGVVKQGAKYELQCDFFDSGLGQAIGLNGGKLKQAYAVEKTKIEARRKGYSVTEQQVEGAVKVHVRLN